MMDNKSSNSSEYTLSEEKDSENPKPSGYTPLKEKRRRTALDFISKITDLEVRGEVKGIVNMLLVELDQKEDDASELLKKLQKTDDEKRNVELERNLAQAKLNLRPYLKILERTVFPPWLLDSDFPYKIRWIVSVKFSLTPSAAILLKRVKSTKGITVEILAEAMVELFHQSSDEVQHDKKPGIIILKEREWDLLFQELKIFRNDHKRAVKMALEDIKDNEEPEESSPLNQNKNWVIYVNIIPFNLRRFSPENAQDEIIQCCTVKEEHFKGFYFPMRDEGKSLFTHKVFFVIENVPHHSINQCKENLLKWEPIDAHRFVRYDEAHLYHLA